MKKINDIKINDWKKNIDKN